MTALSPTHDTALQTARDLQLWANSVIGQVEHQSDERLIEIGRDAHSLGQAVFRIRGAVGVEIKRRVIGRHIGPGRPEIGKAMSQAAKQMSIAPSTLQEDVKIFETFADDLGGDTDLDREHFRAALSAPDPHGAIEHAINAKVENPTYSTRDFRDYVTRLNGGEDKEKLEREHWAKVLLTDEAWDALPELCKHRNQDINEAVSVAIVEAASYHKRVR